MRLATIGSIVLLTVSSAALAQMTHKPGHDMHGNNTAMPMHNESGMNAMAPMNGHEPMMNETSQPNATGY